MIAAERTGRQAVLLEIDPAYVDVIVRRWEVASGQPVILQGEDRTFDDIGSQRLSSPVGTATLRA
jgi:DNA modification methylase